MEATDSEAVAKLIEHIGQNLSAPTGQPARAWTEEERERLRAALKELFEEEAELGIVHTPK